MKKIWLIARHHFVLEVSKRSFLIILFSMPLFLTLVIGLGYLAEQLMGDKPTLGYVDEAGFLILSSHDYVDNDVTLLEFGSKAEAQEALETEKIDAFYVLPAEYPEISNAELVYFEPPSSEAIRHFEGIVRLNLLASQSPDVIERVLSGADVSVRATEFNREFVSGAPSAGQLLPILAVAIFAFLVMTTTGYMMQVVVVEKENRTMEIVISSVSPNRLMSGKIAGILGIAFLQLLVWLLFFIAAAWFGAHVLDIEWLQSIDLAWRDFLLLSLVALPTYIFIVAFMTAIGSSLADSQEAEQVGPLLFLVLFLPVYLLLPIASNPNGPLALILTFIPGTSVVTIAVRSLFFEVPVWQIATAMIVAIVVAIVAVWLAGKAYRMSMLRYGQRLKLPELLGRSSTGTKTSAASNL